MSTGALGFRTILLAYDGTERGRKALHSCLPLLRASGAEVHLLAVVSFTGAVAAEGFFTESLYADERERVQAILDEGLHILAGEDIEATGHIRCGEPARLISAIADGIGADLVVVGHLPRGPLARWWQGSVGASLIDLLDCSLLVLQSPDDGDPQ